MATQIILLDVTTMSIARHPFSLRLTVKKENMRDRGGNKPKVPRLEHWHTFLFAVSGSTVLPKSKDTKSTITTII